MYGDGARPATAATADGAATPAVNALAAIDVARIPNRQGQELRNTLTERLNPARLADPTRYTLKINLKQDVRQLAVDRSGLATRGNLTMNARYSLTEDASGHVLLTAGARSVAGFNLLAGQQTAYFSTVVAAQDAENRAIEQIAGQILARLGAFFETRGTAGGGEAAPQTEVVPGFSEETETTLDDAGLGDAGLGDAGVGDGGLDPLPRGGDPFGREP